MSPFCSLSLFDLLSYGDSLMLSRVLYLYSTFSLFLSVCLGELADSGSRWEVFAVKADSVFMAPSYQSSLTLSLSSLSLGTQGSVWGSRVVRDVYNTPTCVYIQRRLLLNA